MTKEIPLTQGKVSLVDDEDYENIMVWKWNFDGYYATRMTPRGLGKRKPIRMHTQIAKTPSGMCTDHINGNKLDNRKCNLRICAQVDNHANKGLSARNTSGYKGVSYDKTNNKWKACLKYGNIRKHLGRFPTAKEAAIAYNNFAEKVSSFIRKNVIED